MKYYFEIVLKPQPEIPLYFLWEKVSQQIHLALVEIKDVNDKVPVGISFPEYDACQFQLGCKLRLFAEEKEDLTKLNVDKWLSRLCDYLHVKPIEYVPQQNNGYACFRHVKLKGNKEKLARRRAKRKGESFEQALSFYNDYDAPESKLPFINMHSLTNSNNFRIYIAKEIKEQPKTGFFSCYGLSNETTVPLF